MVYQTKSLECCYWMISDVAPPFFYINKKRQELQRTFISRLI